MKNTKAIKNEVIKREVNLVNTIQSVSLQTGGGATSGSSATPSGSATPGGSGGANGGAVDWKRKYKEEFDKRFAIEEQYDDLQTQVKTHGHFKKYTVIGENYTRTTFLKDRII